jgi:hypothetical protein
MGVIRMVCYQVECDRCTARLDDYGQYMGMDTPEAACRYAVDHADWHPMVNGSFELTGILCPTCSGGAAA